jgi:hypothetical protein
MIYLASPYNHRSPFVREARYLAAMEAVTLLMQRRIWVFSPIVHCHEFKKIADLPPSHEFWLAYDLHILEQCEALYILAIDGYRESLGVGAERAHATSRKMPIFLVHMSNGSLDILPFA